MPTDRLEFDCRLYTMMRLPDSCAFETVLDVDSGSGEQDCFVLHFGKKACTVDLHRFGLLRRRRHGRQVRPHVRRGVVLSRPRASAQCWRLRRDVLHAQAQSRLAISVPTRHRMRTTSGDFTSRNAGLRCNDLTFSEFGSKETQVFRTRDLSVSVRASRAQGADVLEANRGTTTTTCRPARRLAATKFCLSGRISALPESQRGVPVGS
jgi:hypothetical protein